MEFGFLLWKAMDRVSSKEWGLREFCVNVLCIVRLSGAD